MFEKKHDLLKKNIFFQKCREINNFSLGNNRGVAMIYAIIVGMVVMAFCLSLLLVTYTLFAQTNRKNSQLQCKMMVQTFAEQLKQDLKGNAIDSGLADYMGSSIKSGNWKALDDENAIKDGTDYTKLIVDCDSEVGYTYHVVFTYLVNTADDDEEDSTGTNPDESNTSNGGNEEDKINCTLYSKITCQRGSEKDRDIITYTVNDEYDVSITLPQ